MKAQFQRNMKDPNKSISLQEFRSARAWKVTLQKFTHIPTIHNTKLASSPGVPTPGVAPLPTRFVLPSTRFSFIYQY
ncbi:hypothetical protein E2C01_040360 [Portunus trituberculatus]|uniref:Uncharacterized protein n=1 Tax=Portunus trituberculatus TaxID=210409 RepID=A0A5B7FMC6_PORTR|nr:hypothetical protein [Portunus trituberculatus]